MLEKIYATGQEVVVFSPAVNKSFKAQVVGSKMIEFSRGYYFKYQLLTAPGDIGEFNYYQVFEKDDWDGEKLKMHDTFHFEMEALQYGIDPAAAINSIVEKLNDLNTQLDE